MTETKGRTAGALKSSGSTKAAVELPMHARMSGVIKDSRSSTIMLFPRQRRAAELAHRGERTVLVVVTHHHDVPVAETALRFRFEVVGSVHAGEAAQVRQIRAQLSRRRIGPHLAQRI